MIAAARLLEINPRLDRRKLAASFSESKRIQVRNVLTAASAQRIATLLAQETPWGLCWNAGLDGPHRLRAEQVNALPQAAVQGMLNKVSSAMQAGNFAFIYSQYLMNDAKVLGWSRSPKHDSIVDDLNSPPFLDLAREVTGIPELKWADSQATLYGPGQFLAMHQDVAEGEARRIAYVLNFCSDAWRPDWGGYLNFYDKEGDIVAGYKPRFNSLNMFLIPQDHNVSFVPGFAPHARFAITGWLRDK
jgi:Rps23 Pro-64 3,4-dihydroxylase Tpa1-like proline 4-hydroxylase